MSEKKCRHLHFKGKDVVGHLREARMRGKIATEETHGVEMPGYLSAACDSAKETSLYLLFLFLLVPSLSVFFFAAFAFAVLLWKAGRSALLGWNRLERLHRLIEQERWEIQHHRTQEREELSELYQTKGFGGKLLEEVLDVLMADDNRLLQVMLEEELCLTMEVYEHPLQQAAGAAVGVVIAACVFLSAFLVPYAFAPLIGSALTIGVASYFCAKGEDNETLPAVIWTLATAALASGVFYLLLRLIRGNV